MKIKYCTVPGTENLNSLLTNIGHINIIDRVPYVTQPKPVSMGGLCSKAGGALDADLNSTARNTNDTAKIRRLVQQGARLDSTNGAPWHHTALHQACYHNRPEIVRTLLELGAYELCAHLPSNPCGRGGSGFPIDLARGGGHHGTEQVRVPGEAVAGRNGHKDYNLNRFFC